MVISTALSIISKRGLLFSLFLIYSENKSQGQCGHWHTSGFVVVVVFFAALYCLLDASWEAIDKGAHMSVTWKGILDSNSVQLSTGRQAGRRPCRALVLRYLNDKRQQRDTRLFLLCWSTNRKPRLDSARLDSTRLGLLTRTRVSFHHFRYSTVQYKREEGNGTNDAVTASFSSVFDGVSSTLPRVGITPLINCKPKPQFSALLCDVMIETT